MLTSEKDFISLNRTEISHFDYHWFWGLRYNKFVQTPNMISRLDELMQNDGLLHSLQAQHVRIDGYYFITRFFYRLFNIDNYTLNAYSLVFLDAYEAHQAQEKKAMYSDTTAGTPEGQRKPSWSQWAQDAIISFGKRNGLLDTEQHPSIADVKRAYHKALLLAHPDKEDAARDTNISFGERNGLLSTEQHPSTAEASEEFPDTWRNVADALSPQFKVNREMQPYLKVLGMHVKHGDSLSIADVKRAYHKALLFAHSDKEDAARDNISFGERNGLLNTEQHPSIGEASEEFPETGRYVADALSPQIKVNREMQPYLKVLGMHVNHGDNLTKDDVKRAYRKALLLTHPDRGGSATAFRNLQAAKYQLDKLLSPEQDAWMSQNEYFSDALDEIIRRYDKIDRVYDNIDRVYDNIDRLYDNIERNLDEIERRLTRLEQMSQPIILEEEYVPVEETSSSTKPWLMICS